MRVLLIQARGTADIERQEQECFLERCRLRPEQLVTANVVRDRLHEGLLDGVHAVMIGGAGEFSATQDYPWMDDLLALCRLLRARGFPTFGSCWGHQILARAYGGTVIHDHARAELGCHPVMLTEAGRRDPLFRTFPPAFRANMGHHDRVSVLPEGAVELAYSATQPNQAFRMEDLPIYGTQFHSELDARRERERLIRYRAYYLNEMPDEAAFQHVLDSLAETTEVDHLLHDFLTTFVARPENHPAGPQQPT
ncbi:type 1 glutamine amidotransferase [Rhodocaloribacter litoris]|nr:type 1 glutamine amidotransferase [Rhodocaloribacter litoris]